MDETAFRRIVAGERKDLTATVVRTAAAVAALPYGLAVSVRNWCYDRGVLPSWTAGVPVVSVGNLTTGGTGKTPMVALVVKQLQRLGLKPGILSRGYRATTHRSRSPSPNTTPTTPSNDEWLVLERLCPAVPHVQHPDRVKGAAEAVQAGCNVLVLDDGFQHRRLRRDLDIVLVDATNPWGFGHLLPRGLLREPRSSLQRAHLLVVTRIELCEPEQVDALCKELKQLAAPETPLVRVAFQPTCLINSLGKQEHVSCLRDRSVLAFCGIGNPESFERTVRSTGAKLQSLVTFPDHYVFSDEDLRQLGEEATRLDAEMLITTLKDLVKIKHADVRNLPLWALHVEPVVQEGKQHLERLLAQLAQAAK